MRFFLAYILAFFTLCTSSAQESQWWSYDQEYRVISLSETGVYRLGYSLLAAHGVPVDEISSGAIRLYNKGEEVTLYATTNEVMQSDDYFLFYGEKNDGKGEEVLYAQPEDQLNPNHSLITYENIYYLTWTPQEESTARYTIIDNALASAASDEPYYIYHERHTYDEHHSKPIYNGRDFIRYSDFGPGEGYGAKPAKHTELKIPVSDLSDFGASPYLQLRFGTNVHSRAWQIRLNGHFIKNIVQPGYGAVEIRERFPLDLIDSDTVTVTIQSLNNTDEKHSIAYYDLAYPRRYTSMDGVYHEYQQQQSILSRRMSLTAPQVTHPLLLNVSQHQALIPQLIDDVMSYALPASFSEDRIVLLDINEGSHAIEEMQTYRFEQQIDSADYLIITHASLMDAAQQYADYRESTEGGAHSVSIVDVDELYHHFSFGIKNHAGAIRSYISSLADAPDYIFIIGKGVEYNEVRDNLDKSLVPTYGIPGSDNLLLAHWGENSSRSAIGRLAAQSPQDVDDYLDKIKQHELANDTDQTIADQAYKKKIIHLSGGSSDIQNLLYNYLNNMGSVLQHNQFGGAVETFRKTSADPIQTAKSREIIDAIDQGSALLSFFGHSAVGTFDFSLEDPNKYHNKGKNPVLLSMGCYSGNLHTPSGGISEDFVLAKDVGATHFMASSGTAYINPQYQMGLLIYELLGEEYYERPIGDIVKEVMSARMGNTDIAVQTLLQQWTLHGDPSYRLKGFAGPDYVVDEQSVTTTPSEISSTTSQFSIAFDVVNIGKYSQQPLDVQIIHEWADGEQHDTTMLTITAPAYSQHIGMDINNPGYEAIGENKIYITIDPKNQLTEKPGEKAEKNNDLNVDGQRGYAFFVTGNSASPVYPQDFGIVTSDAEFVLQASMNNAFAYDARFIMQIDTTEQFDSPLLESVELDQQSSHITWAPTITKIAETVYYWRITPISDRQPAKRRWQTRSFVYRPGESSGYNQSHYYQWLRDDYQQMYVDSTSRAFSYDDRQWDIRIKNKLKDPNDFWVFVNSSPWSSLNPKEHAPGIQVFAWHPDQIIVPNGGTDYGSIDYSPDGFVFKTETADQRKGLMDLLHELPEGSRVFLHTILEDEYSYLHIDQWAGDKDIFGESLIDVLKTYGALRTDELIEKGTVPYTLIFEKGKGLIVEDMGDRIDETIDLSSTASSHWNNGSMISTPIGPVDRYMRLHWAEQKSGEDQTELLVIGISQTGQREVLKTIKDDYSVNLTSINPDKYPRIQLQYKTADPERTTAQLLYWRVQATQLSDAILQTSAEHPFLLPDTVHAGEELELQYRIYNSGPRAFDEVLVSYRLVDQMGQSHSSIQRTESIPAGEHIDVTATVPTDGRGGQYQLVVEINANEEQAELTTINNFGLRSVYIKPDKQNPFLTVTVDGAHRTADYISDGRPEIMVSLADPGSAVLLDNPQDVDIKLWYPDNFLRRKIKHDAEDVTYIPAIDLSDNTMRFLIEPYLNVKGIYTIEVSAKDKAGNAAGEHSYRAQFTVADAVEETSISIQPNPFVDRTMIRYYYRGNNLPRIFYINIYDSVGRLVRTITRQDVGGLFYGWNDYEWDGTNQAGAPVPPGVYHYQVVNSNDTSDKKLRGSIIKLPG